MASTRLSTIARHVCASEQAEPPQRPTAAEILRRRKQGVSPLTQPIPELIDMILRHAEDVSPDPKALLPGVPGPLDDVGPPRTYADKFAVIKELFERQLHGSNHLLWAEYAERYGRDGLASNILVPYPEFGRSEITGERMMPKVSHMVILSHPEDCERIARKHLGKHSNFTNFIFGSVLSTQDTDNWRHQRNTFNEAFLPRSSLAKVLPVTLGRARKCGAKLAKLSDNGLNAVDMNEFFLHETQAQLQLAMMGETEEFMEKTNRSFRRQVAGEEAGRLTEFLSDVVERAKDPKHQAPVPGCPMARVHGPLSAKLREVHDLRVGTLPPGDNESLDQLTKVGNALILEFAGHDTTGHTLTWLLLELCRNPAIQRKLRAEVDALWAMKGDRDFVYDDFKQLPYMTRCITETMRLWTVVPQGTFRVLGADDEIHVGDRLVKVPKGTTVQIQNWTRHRNPDLWGPDVNEFNPDREWDPVEIWHGEGFAAYNPHTKRFSPFTHPPRDCLGNNFAQMEARAILVHLLRDFEFHLAEPHKSWVARQGADVINTLGANLGTLGPRDVSRPEMVTYGKGVQRPPYGLFFHAVKREW